MMDTKITIPYYHVDAFTNHVFSGNPAGVCPLKEWLDDITLQKIAAENNLSETAFFVKQKDHFDLRWFTPKTEIDLCGHATLASAFVLFHSRQGLALFLCEMAVFVVSIVFPFLMKPFLFVFALFSFWGMLKALKGEQFKLPFIYPLSERLVL